MKRQRLQDPFYFCRHKNDLPGQPHQYYCGGFGGGPNQIAHAATTYAAILALCILATEEHDDGYDDKDDGDNDGDDNHDDGSVEVHYSVKAQQLLQDVRIPMYRWMVSLQQPDTGGYRMHHDGEVDVRATYTIMTCAKLLQLLPPKTSKWGIQRQQVIDYVVSCQTYEGGIGGEPFSEAHGGYTFCGLAALEIMGALDRKNQNNAPMMHQPPHSKLDIPALVGWLARRQMSYEGGFSGRANKLVDGCYSFWQGGALAIASSYCVKPEKQKEPTRNDEGEYNEKEGKSKNDRDGHHSWRDPWLQQHQNQKLCTSTDTTDNYTEEEAKLSFPLLFDVAMLERYILLCAQEIHGGLRDKPSTPRDFYHTCYNLSGLSVAQHCSHWEGGTEVGFGDPKQTALQPTHPTFNICVDRVAAILNKKWELPE
jgi:protein farnesyltransferase subunit beta